MSPSPGDTLVCCVKKVPIVGDGQRLHTAIRMLWRWCLHLPVWPEPATLHLKKRIHFKVEIKTCWPRHVRRAALPQRREHCRSPNRTEHLAAHHHHLLLVAGIEPAFMPCSSMLSSLCAGYGSGQSTFSTDCSPYGLPFFGCACG